MEGAVDGDDGVRAVHSFDGQTVWKTRTSPFFEVGNFLGGGAAGTVYECEDAESHEHYALKILNPLGFRLVAPALLRKCTVLHKGKVHKDSDKEKENTLGIDSVWWLLDAATKQYIAAYFSERQNCLKDLTLTQCIEIWGHDPPGVTDDEGESQSAGEMVEVVSSSSGQKTLVPKTPPKYSSFVRRRGRLFREIKNMRKISTHKNVIKLVRVLELNQESKCTIFLVMELANGGELFDRIKIDHGTRESTAKYFFQQLLEGVRHCHEQGVCHRDLKPENLLLQDTDQGTILKIADFGFSARFALAENSVDADDSNREDWKQRNDMNASEAAHSRQQQQQQVMHTSLTPVAPASYLEEYTPMKVLKSVVGSPFYVAPEVLQAKGYDGPRADIWSLGVILYAMLAGNLPFGQELATCKRFRHFCKWVREQEKQSSCFWEKKDLEFPPWLFPANFSVMAKGLIVSMLHPDPNCRLTIKEAKQHPLCAEEEEIVEQEEEVVMHQAIVSEEGGVDAEDEEKAGVDSMIDMMAVASVNSAGDYNQNMDGIDDGVFTMEEDAFDMESESTAMRSGPVSSIDLAAMDSGVMSAGGNSSDGAGARDMPIPPYPAEDQRPLEALSPPSASRMTDMAFSPPPVPSMLTGSTSIDNLVIDSDDEGTAPVPPIGVATHPPEFSDLVKKSSRFLTVVPAVDVLSKVSSVLEDCRAKRIPTPLGLIGYLKIDWNNFRLEVWGLELSGPPLFAMQLYEVPETHSHAYASSPAHTKLVAMAESQLASSFGTGRRDSYSSGGPKTLYMVEFVREALDIFVFKRFYEWVRQSFSQLVKRDAGAKHLL